MSFFLETMFVWYRLLFLSFSEIIIFFIIYTTREIGGDNGYLGRNMYLV